MEPHFLHVASSEKQRFYLSESVNAWMTSLRHKMDNYCSCCGVNDEHDVINLYQIKTLPVHNSRFNCSKCLIKAQENNINKYHLINDDRVLKRFYEERAIFEKRNTTRRCMKFATTPAKRVLLNMKSNYKHERNFKQLHADHRVELQNKELLLLLSKEIELRHLTYLNLDDFYVNKLYTNHGKYKNNQQHKATITTIVQPNKNDYESSDTLKLLKMRISLIGAQQLSTEIDLVTNSRGSRALAKQSNTTKRQRSAVTEVDNSYVVSIKISNALQACFINELEENVVNIVCKEKEQQKSRISYQVNHHHHQRSNNNNNNNIIREKSVDKTINTENHADNNIVIEILLNSNSVNFNENRILFNAKNNNKQELWRIYNIENLFKNILLSLGINSLIINYDQLLRIFFNCINKKNNSRYLILPRTSDILIKKFQRFQLKYQEQQQLQQQQHKEPRLKLREPSANKESLIASESYEKINNNNKNNKQQQTVCVGVVGSLEKVNSSTTNTTSNATFDVNNHQVVAQLEKTTSEKLCQTQSTLKLRKFIVVGTRVQPTCAETTVKSFYNNCKIINDLKIIKKNNISNRVEKNYEDKEFQLSNLQMPERYSIKKFNFTNANLQHYQLKYKDKKNTTYNSKKINKAKMTIPIANSTNSTHNKSNESLKYIAEEENIYQPIWKFKTVGEAQEDRMPAEGDYYRITEGQNDYGSKSQLSNDSSLDGMEHVADYSEWETDDEFMFTLGRRSSAVDTMQSGNLTLGSTCSNSSDSRSIRSTGAMLPLSAGRESTSFAAVIMNHSSESYQLFRDVAIFYSLSEPKMRAIKYDYDRIHAWRYFAANSIARKSTKHSIQKNNISSLSENFLKPSRNLQDAHNNAAIMKSKIRSIPKLSDSVQAWKFMLLDTYYIEDEEDMNVRENDLMGIREIIDNLNVTPAFQNTISRFKSASIGNLVDLPIDEDKKSIAERMRNKLSRGVFKLNMRSPKNEKKSRGIFRVGQTTSLYLAEGTQPKYPIFGVPLDKLELNETTHPNVPRFVVDCIQCIEQKDNIRQEGLYRASGNKVWIDDLKKILTDSYIYDARLLVTDDIHTLTSLLKQFFRQLSAPLIPHEIIEQIGNDLSSSSALQKIRKIFSQIKEPNRSTLKFLIQHLTNVAAWSFENRMPASNLAIVWGPCLLSVNQFHLDIGRTNTLAKILIENYSRIFEENERLVF